MIMTMMADIITKDIMVAEVDTMTAGTTVVEADTTMVEVGTIVNFKAISYIRRQNRVLPSCLLI
jgi:hypothetical protein